MVETSSEASSVRRRAAYQESQDQVVAFALQGRAVGHGQQILGLFARQPVPQASPLLSDIWDVSQVRGLFHPDRPPRTRTGRPGLSRSCAGNAARARR